jgi:hypothetical protein
VPPRCHRLASRLFLACFLTLPSAIAAGAAASGRGEAAEGSPPGRVYTNEDLARVAPLRGQTGVDSVPTEAGTTAASASRRRGQPGDRAEERGGGRGESYWRRESERVQERVRALRRQADDLRRRTDEIRREPGVLPLHDPRMRELRRQIESLEARIREMEGDLEDRARRAGAPPGWLR